MADALPKIDDDHITLDNHLILELVLLRVGSPTCLVRAAATCKLWRRVIADCGFLQLYCSLHTPPVPGYYFNRVSPRPPELAFHIYTPTFVPSPSSSDLTIDTSYFSVDFLPDGPKYWKIWDSRSSLLLVNNLSRDHPCVFPRMLAVCEPLTRGYMRIAAPPNFDERSSQVYKCYLVDGNEGEAGRCISMSNFRVLCEVLRGGITHAAVFTVTGGVGSWSEKAFRKIIPKLHHKRCFGRAGGSWYYVVADRTVVAFDGHTGEYYSPFPLPSGEGWPCDVWNSPVDITDGRDGKPRIFSTEDNILKVFARLDSCGGCDWVLVKKVSLQEATRGLPGYKSSFFRYPLVLCDSGTGFVTLTPIGRESWPFTVDLETMEVSPALAQDMQGVMFRYQLPWPPVLHAALDPTDS